MLRAQIQEPISANSVRLKVVQGKQVVCSCCPFQVMVFVHSRNSTVKTARTLRDMAQQQGKLPKFQVQQSSQYVGAEKQVSGSCDTLVQLNRGLLLCHNKKTNIMLHFY